MGKTILVSPKKIDTDSMAAIALWLLMTTTATVMIPVLPNLLEARDNEIEFDMVDVNYRFGSDNDNFKHPAWFDEETEEVILFDTGRQGHGKIKIYDHHFSVPGNSFKKAKSATRMVWEEYKDPLKEKDPILYQLLEEFVSWIDELDSRESEHQEEIKKVIYNMMAPIAMQAAGHKGVKIYTNHISGISFLPKLIAKEARELKYAHDKASELKVLQHILNKTLIAMRDYISRGKEYLLSEYRDWELLSEKITIEKINPLIDLVVVKESPLHISTLRYRLNQRYQEESLKKYYILIATFSQSQNLRIYKSFPEALAEFDLDECKHRFMRNYDIPEKYTYMEGHGNSLSLNRVKEHTYIVDDAIVYCQNNIKMKIPPEQIVQFFKVVDDIATFIDENTLKPEKNIALFSNLEKLLRRDSNAAIEEKSAAVEV